MAQIITPGPSTRSTSPMKYQVFLSFRGKDTRTTFTDHLYTKLREKGIVTFRDGEEIEKGEDISEELFKAIEQSMFFIIVLSQNFASSSWCLKELEMIIEYTQNFRQRVFPVFYDVDPSDIRYATIKFASAFQKHETRFLAEEVERWRKALTKVANLSGWDTRNKQEAEIVEDIAKFVRNKVWDELWPKFEDLVGDIQSKVDTIISLLKIESDDKSFVGIWGIGGIGKTTLARVVYYSIRSNFDTCCFLERVRENSENGRLVDLQKKLLYDLGVGEKEINDSFEGAQAIENSLCHKKVLIVFDDVSHEKQLENLAKKKEWFGAGSKIIITTRDKHLLTRYEQFGAYEVGILHPDESLQLLCQKAFGKDEPEQGYLDLSKEAIKYASGLPLALEVTGSCLRTREQYEWRKTLDMWKKNLGGKFFSPLRISYDGLDNEEFRTIFLDIACFFNGKKKIDVTNILEICGLHPNIGIKVLIEKSLLSSRESSSNSRQNAKEDQDMHDRLQKMRRDIFMPTYYDLFLQEEASKEYLDMHDLLQEMGRDIILQESPNDASRRSRLWSSEDIDLVLKGNKGGEKVQSIVLDLRKRPVGKFLFQKEKENFFEANWHPDCFAKMQNLRLLILSGVLLSNNLNSLPTALKFLRWDDYPLESLPSIDQLYEIESMELRDSKIRKLWSGTPFLDMLRIINLKGCDYIIETPDFSGTPNIEKLLLDHCKNLVRVHESVGQLKKMVRLSLEFCTNLIILPSCLETDGLEEFILSGCRTLEKLPKFGKYMRSLYWLDVTYTKITEIPSSIIHLTNLKFLDVGYCKRLKSMPKLPPNLIIYAGYCTLLEKPTSALRHLIASCVSKGPIHLVSDTAIGSFNFHERQGIPSWFERKEHRHSKGNSGEVVTITANIPSDVAENEGECWAIAVCVVFECFADSWKGFSINWKFQDHCHPQKSSHGTNKLSRNAVFESGDSKEFYPTDEKDCRFYVGLYGEKESYPSLPGLAIDSRVYIGYYPIDKENCRQHPNGVCVGSQVDLTLSFPITNTIDAKNIYRNWEIGDCGWRLVCKKDFDECMVDLTITSQTWLPDQAIDKGGPGTNWRCVVS